MSDADSLFNTTDSATINLTKRFLETINNATTHCISEHLNLFDFPPSPSEECSCRHEYLDVARQEKMATAVCTFAGVLGWAVRMGVDPWWEGLEDCSPDNIYWYLGPCCFSVIIISRWGWSARRPDLLPFQVLIAIFAFMHIRGFGTSRRRNGRKKAVDEFLKLDMVIIPGILRFGLGVIWAFLLSSSLKED